MGCQAQLKVVLALFLEHSRKGKLSYVPLERLYNVICNSNDESCKAVVRSALNSLWRQGLVDKHYSAKNKREYRLAGEFAEMWKQLDMLYRYGSG